MRICFRSLVVFLLSFSVSGYADDYLGNWDKSYSNEDWYKQCMQVKDIEPLKKDLPSPSDQSTSSKCDSIDLYYSTKSTSHPTEEDWRKVRNCAFVDKEEPVYGSLVLMMIYANGYGVPRNPKLAIKYACEWRGTEGEMISRIPHIAEMSGSDTIDMCDDATGGVFLQVCSGIDREQKEKVRNAWLSAFTEKLNEQQKSAFDKLRIAVKDFATSHSDGEVDTSGTAYVTEIDEAYSEELDLFVTDLRNYENGKTPKYTSEQFLEADKALNTIYQNIQNANNKRQNGGSAEEVKKTERAWLKYRDAWVSFGRLRYLSVDSTSWKTLLTQRRVEQLSDIAEWVQ